MITKFYLFCSLMVILPSFSPTLAALALTSLVILVSNAFQGPRKIAFQSFFFLSGLSCALTYLVVKQNEMVQFFAVDCLSARAEAKPFRRARCARFGRGRRFPGNKRWPGHSDRGLQDENQTRWPRVFLNASSPGNRP